MQRLHIVGRKNHGKTLLIEDLILELTERGLAIGTIKHTHHRHELDVPGKDSYRHRMAGASVVGILSPSMNAVFMPTAEGHLEEEDYYSRISPLFRHCHFVLVEGDSQTTAPKVEVWRSELGTEPLATRDDSILVVVTDDKLTSAHFVLPRGEVGQLTDWICAKMLGSIATPDAIGP